MVCAILQIHVDESLIRDPAFFSEFFKISDRGGIDLDRDLLLQLFRIRVLSVIQLTDIVFFSHAYVLFSFKLK